jgi:hypothetical protein
MGNTVGDINNYNIKKTAVFFQYRNGEKKKSIFQKKRKKGFI